LILYYWKEALHVSTYILRKNVTLKIMAKKKERDYYMIVIFNI